MHLCVCEYVCASLPTFDFIGHAYQDALALLESHLRHDILDSILNLFPGRMLHSQFAVKGEMLLDGQRPDENVSLLHEDGVVRHLLLFDDVTVDHHVTAHNQTISVG